MSIEPGRRRAGPAHIGRIVVMTSIVSAASAPAPKLHVRALSAAAAGAAHVQPALYAMAELGLAGAIESFAAWLASR